MATPASPKVPHKALPSMLWQPLLLPTLVLIFYLAAPSWYGSKVHGSLRDQIAASQQLSESDKQQRTAYFDGLDLQQLCLHCPPGMEELRKDFEEDGIVSTFEILRLGQILSWTLLGGVAVTMLAVAGLNAIASKYPSTLISSYRLGWRIVMTASLIKLALLIPLLTYGSYELMALSVQEYSIKLLFAIVIGGIVAFGTCIGVLMKKVPMEFAEPLSREISPEEAPELWHAIRQAADTLQTAAPDRLIIGMQMNFFVTELAVHTDTSRVTGRTLYLSYPLLKQLSAEEVLAIVGHELGHFKGNDTKMTREFYPLRFKVHETLMGLSKSGIVGWPSAGLLGFFHLSFEQTMQKASRVREFLADQVGGSLTSPVSLARALVKFSVLSETFERMLRDPVANPNQNPMDLHWRSFVSAKILEGDLFWTQLATKETPHPLDSHPSLHDRLDGLGSSVQVADARAISLQEESTAYDAWLAHHDALFADLGVKVVKAVGEIRAKLQLADADYATAEGKALLDQNFPEIRWRLKGGRHVIGIIMLGMVALLCVLALFVVPDLWPKVLLLSVVGLFFWIAIQVWKSRGDKEMILTVEGISYPEWKGPLLFSNVASMSLTRVNSMLQANFELKRKQKQLGKWALPIATRSVMLPLRRELNEKPDVVAQTIYRYLTRQPLP